MDDTQGVPVEVDEDETVRVEDETMEELVFGRDVDWTGQCDDFMRSTP
jgi:hypothetical protein